MKLTTEELRTRLDAIAWSPEDPTTDRADVDRRARHVRRRRGVVGAGVACIVLLGGALAVVDWRPDGTDDQRLRTIDDPPVTNVGPSPEPDAITTPHTRTLDDGSSVTLAFEEPAQVYGPLGLGAVWQQPADCPRALHIAVTDPTGTTRTGSTTADPGASEPTVAKTLMPYSGGDATGAGATVPDLAFTVLRPRAGATYQLTGADGTVVDESPSDGTMLVLFGPSAVSPATPGGAIDVEATLNGAEGGAPAYRIRTVGIDGSVDADEAAPVDLGPGFIDVPGRCTVPDRPVDLTRRGAPSDIRAATAAVDALAESLVVGDQPADTLVSVATGAEDLGPLAAERGFRWMTGVRSEATEIVWDSPTTGWVHLSLYQEVPGTTDRVPMAKPWIRVTERPEGWRTNRRSACAVLASSPGTGLLGATDGNC